MEELLFLKPQFKEKIWGGSRLRECFGYDVPGDHVGEAWQISGHPEGSSMVEGGTYDGERLDVLWERHPELFGNEDGHYGSQYPLLVKLINAEDDLSIQVHPDDEYAGIHENGSLGKMECWYILDCKPGATIIIGHQAGSRQEMEEMIRQGRWKDFIREIPIKKGDFFQIPPGCLHAIKGGTLLLETQQSSDITYRVYDYGRLSGGNLRPLHLDQAMEVITVPWQPEASERNLLHTETADREFLQSCPYYTVERCRVHGIWEHYFHHGFTNVSVTDGAGTVNGIPIKRGMNFIVPAGFGSCRFEGELEMIISWAMTKERRAGSKTWIRLEVLDWMGRVKAWAEDEKQAVLAFEDIYEEGDRIRLTVPETGRHYGVRIDDVIEESLIYLTEKEFTFDIPFGEKKKSWNPKAFTGRRHYLTCRLAESYEVEAYRNLAKNTLDQHGGRGHYPHASANVETRGESVFAARNAIDGVTANHSHGSWPYESWGINQRDDAQFLLEFGRPVTFDRIVLRTRADFPHDNWWVQAKLEFSDGSQEIVEMKKTDKGQEFMIKKTDIVWIRIKDLVKSDDPSPFPALTQVEVYGRDAS